MFQKRILSKLKCGGTSSRWRGDGPRSDRTATRPGVGNLRPKDRMRPAKAFHPTRDLLLTSGPRPFPFFNDRYAAINRRNDSHLIF